MKIENLSKTDLEDIEKIGSLRGFKLLKEICDTRAKKLMNDAINVKTRTITHDKVTITETADEQLQRLAGELEGMNLIIGYVDTAYQRRKKNE